MTKDRLHLRRGFNSSQGLQTARKRNNLEKMVEIIQVYGLNHKQSLTAFHILGGLYTS